MRILEYRITGPEDGWSVEYYLRNRLGFGKKQISRLKFREYGLQLNGCQCRTTDILKEGDRFCLRLDEEGKSGRIRETAREEDSSDSLLTVLYEDADVLAVYKPGGTAVHPSHGHSRDTLWNQIVSLQRKRGEDWTPRIIGRLDKDTSGIILFAKTTEAAAALAGQRERKVLRKVYVADAEGAFSEKEGKIDLAIEKDPDYLNRMRIGKEGLPACTHYRLLREHAGNSILRLELDQGRTHQIRVHLSAIGHPVVGDPIYHPDYEGKTGPAELHLHAAKLCFVSPFTGKEIVIKAPLPKWLEGGIEI